MRGLDALITNRVWLELGYPPETTLHDLRWGRQFTSDTLDAYVWVLLISGGAPPAHFIGGYGGTSSERQPPMYFRFGGGCRVARGGDERALGTDDTAVADHACRPSRNQP